MNTWRIASHSKLPEISYRFALTSKGDGARRAEVMRFLLLLAVLFFVPACGPSGPQGPVRVAIISDDTSIDDAGMRLSPAGQHLRAATREGLVAIDETGQVIPALAERWIVTEDGLSYIFRLRNTNMPDGSTMSADDIQSSMQRALRQLRGTSLGLDLSKIDEIRAMTGRVIEVRLTSPMPDFLRLLAQPELGFANDDAGTGPMRRTNADDEASIILEALPLEARGLPSREDWEEGAREIILQALTARQAVDAFSSGEVDLVLNGQIADLTLADTGPLTRGTVRLDAALGTFGLIVRSERGVLSEPAMREAVAMAIDRSDLMQPFNIGGWQATTWIIPLDLAGESGPQNERWANLSISERRDLARGRVESWERIEGEVASLRISLPAGPGSDLLFRQLEQDLEQIGIDAVRATDESGADLELVDRLARYYSPRWFLNQFNCRLEMGLCSSEADDLVEQSIFETDLQAKQRLLLEAQAEMIRANIFIPLGAPVRWSLVRGDIQGFEENAWGFHPLFQLASPSI